MLGLGFSFELGWCKFQTMKGGREALCNKVGYISQHEGEGGDEVFVESICESIRTQGQVVIFGLDCFGDFQWSYWSFKESDGGCGELRDVI